jgi:DNA-binding PadR family transcriptional regulator
MTKEKSIPLIPRAFQDLKDEETLSTRDCVPFYKDNTATIKNLEILKSKGYIENLNDREDKKGKNGRNRFRLTEKGEKKLVQQLKELAEQEYRQEVAELNNVIQELEKITRPFSLFDRFIDNSEDSLSNIYREKIQQIYAENKRFQTVYQDSEDQRFVEMRVIAPCREKIQDKLEELKPKFEEKFKELQPDIEELKALLLEYRLKIATFNGKPQQVSTGQPVYSEPRIFVEYEKKKKSVPISQAQQYRSSEAWSVYAPHIQKLIDNHKQKIQVLTSSTDFSESVHANLCIGKYPDLSFSFVAQKCAGTAMFEAFEQYKKKIVDDKVKAHVSVVREIIKQENLLNVSADERIAHDKLVDKIIRQEILPYASADERIAYAKLVREIIRQRPDIVAVSGLLDTDSERKDVCHT